VRANEQHQEWLKTLGYQGKRKNVDRSYNYDLPVSAVRIGNAAQVSNAIGNGFKGRSVDDYKWRKNVTESAATVKAIEEKKKRVAPAYNKGATQYITDGTDPTYLGRKV
jgi:hypothetical protein